VKGDAKVKKGTIVLGIACVFMIMKASMVCAGGYELPMLGSRVLGMGGAFIATADDWTAIYWNPAGLSQQEHWGLGVTVFSPHYTLTDGNSISNYDAPQMTYDQGDIFMRVHPTLSGMGDEPLQFGQKTVSASAYNPGIGAYWAMPVGVLGLGFYTPMSDYVEWDSAVKDPTTQADITASYTAKTTMSMANLSFATNPTSNFSAGVGLNLVYGYNEYDADKEYICAAAPPLDYTFDYYSEASGTGLEWMLGARYSIIPQLSVGLVYRSGSKLSLSGTANASHTMLGIDEASDYTQEFHHPATYGVGLACKPVPRLLLGFDWAQADWTTMIANFDYENKGVVLEDVDMSLDWERANSYRLGAEYSVSERLSLQAGYAKDLSAVPDKGVGLTCVTEVDKDVFSLGTGYNFKGPQVNATYMYAGGKRTADGVEYELKANVFIITCAYGF
jgi:long-chain fatty acid transport protein